MWGNGRRRWGTQEGPLDAIVSRVRPGVPFVLRLAQADEPPLVAGELRLVLALAGDRALGRIVLDEEVEEGGEDEGKDAHAEEAHEVQESQGTSVDLTIAGESKRDQVGLLSSGPLRLGDCESGQSVGNYGDGL